LLVAEVLALSLSFDTNTPVLTNHPSVIVRWVARSSLVLRLGICLGTVAATALLGSAHLRHELVDLYQRRLRRRTAWWWVAAHLLTYAVFFWSTGRLIAGISQSAEPSRAVLFWVACGAVTLATWLLAVMPIEFWTELLGHGWKILVAGALVGICALEIGDFTGSFWVAFHGWTFRAASFVLKVVDPEVVCHPETHELGTKQFMVHIAPVCSGFEGIGLIWAFLGGYLVLYRRELRFPQALLLLPIGTLVIWVFNVLRITGLVLLGNWGWPGVALGGFHSQAGWLAFNLVGLGLVAASRWTRMFSTVDQMASREPLAIANPTAAFLLPLMTVVAMAMVTGAMSDGSFDRFYLARIVAGALVLWFCRKGYGGLGWSWSWAAVGIGILVFMIWVAMEPISSRSGGPGDMAISQGLSSLSTAVALLWLAGRVLGSVTVVPLVEELAFRGYLLRRLADVDFQSVPFTRFTWQSLLTSSLLFGLMHQRWLAGTVAGLLYALAVLRQGQLSHAIVAHATTNSLIAAYVLGTGAWSLWS
jgi:exosortase E/protease (VPEID-CTERM system)